MAPGQGKPKILVVDDDEDVRHLCSEVLEQNGHPVVVASDGCEGLERLAQNPDVAAILADWMMPRMSGIEFARAVKELVAPPPIIMMTARNRRDDIMKALQSGVADYIIKPLRGSQLLLRLATLLEARGTEVAARAEQAAAVDLPARVEFVIVDVSETGCCLESSFRAPRHAILLVECTEMAKRLGLAEDFRFPVRVANCEPSGRKYRLGAQFVGLSDEVRSRLRAACTTQPGFRAPGV